MSAYKKSKCKNIYTLLCIRAWIILEMIPLEHEQSNIWSMKESVCMGLFRAASDVWNCAVVLDGLSLSLL